MAAVASGRDVLCCAPPGTGSSTAALLGVITQLLSIPRSVPRGKAWPLALVLCPTRELALQLSGQASQLVAGSQLKVACVTGGAPLAQQVGLDCVCVGGGGWKKESPAHVRVEARHVRARCEKGVCENS